MKDLLKTYNNLIHDHEKLIAQVEENTTSIQYANNDFFSIEPMYAELNNLSAEKLNFYNSIDETPNTNELHICNFDGKHLLQSKYSIGPKTYYENFYTYTENEKWKLQLYSSPELKKAVRVERLTSTKNNLPVCYELYQQNTYWKFDYQFSGDSASVECNYYDGDGNLTAKKVRFVQYSPNSDKIEYITEKTGSKEEIIYRLKEPEASREELLEQAKDHIVNDILEALKDDDPIDRDIDCLLLEYTCQGPFPPQIGLSPKQRLKKGKDPMRYYWVNEMEYVYDTFPSSENKALYNKLNAYYEEDYVAIDYDSEEDQRSATNKIDKDIFDIYVDICKKLKRKKQLKLLIPTTGTFHVTARDFEKYNAWEFLQLLLPKERVKSLSRKLLEYKNHSG